MLKLNNFTLLSNEMPVVHEKKFARSFEGNICLDFCEKNFAGV